MKFHVNERCIGCGLCAGVCPEVFSMAEDMAQAKPDDVAGSVEKKAIEAMDGCPVAAIEKV